MRFCILCYVLLNFFLLPCEAQNFLTQGMRFSTADTSLIRVAPHSNYDIGRGEMTFESWIKIESTTDPDIMLLFSTNDNFYSPTGFMLAVNEQGNLMVKMNSTGLVVPTNLRDNNCHHVAITRSGGSIGADRIKVYLDGLFIFQDNTTLIENDSIPNLESSHLVIGGANDFTFPCNVNGLMGEVRFWNTERTEAELNQNMITELTGVETGLIGYWKMDRIDGQLVKDYSDNQNNAVLGLFLHNTAGDPELDSFCDMNLGSHSQKKQKNQITVYPNPFSQFIQIPVNEDKLSELQFEIISMSTGQILLSGKIPSSSTINTQELLPGLYLLKIISEETLNLTQIVKE